MKSTLILLLILMLLNIVSFVHSVKPVVEQRAIIHERFEPKNKESLLEALDIYHTRDELENELTKLSESCTNMEFRFF